MDKRMYGPFKVMKRNFEQIPLEGGGFTTKEVEATPVAVEVAIDFDALLNRIGQIAAKAKTGKTTLAAGAIVVKRIETKGGTR